MRWNPQLIWTDILAVHAALLHTGEILFFTGNEFWEMQHKRKRYDHVRLFNCQTLEITQVGTRCDISDLFCCGHAFTGNGDLLAAGGTKGIVGSHGSDFHAYHWDGERRTWLFDASTKQFIECAPLNINPDNPDDPDFGFDKERSGGRWYPTLITLGSGQILAIGGHPDVGDDRHSADRPEYFEWNSWRYAEGGRDPDINFNDTANPLEYPRLHLLPDGKVFCSTPFWGNTVWWYGLNKGWTPYFTVTPNTNFKDWHWEGSKDNDPYYKIYNQFNGTSVLLPLLPEHSYAAKVMVHGSENSYLIDLSTPQPAWRKVNGRLLSDHRLTVNSVILPTGEIFFCGGVAAGDFSDQSGVQRAEIYNPDNREWSLTTAAQVVRNYHSVALLMPDGRVWTAGSSKNQAPNNEGDNRELRIEIFEPSYYGSPTRPIIHEVIPESGDVNSGIRGGFTVITDGTNEIKRVAVVRNGSVTHGFSSDQRYVGLPFTTQDHPGGLKALRVSIPDNPNIVVPGYYMLFLIDKDAIPSVGKFINIRLLWSDWFEGREDDCVSTPAVASFGRTDWMFLPNELSTTRPLKITL